MGSSPRATVCDTKTSESATVPRCSPGTPSSSSSPRALPLDGGDPKLRRVGETFDPFVVGGAGASVSKGFKLEVGASTGDIVEGWERAFEGARAPPRTKIGGRRAVRIPPNLAYGDRGHHCRDGVRSACEVAPGQSVEITFEILRYT